MPPIGPILALLGKFWPFIGIGVLVLVVGVQTARLNHAKADQLDHRSCVAGQPCHPIKWEAEAKANEADIAHLTKQVEADQISFANLNHALDEQSAAVEAAHAQGLARTAETDRLVSVARQSAKTAQARAVAALAAKPGADVCRSADDVILGSVQ